MASTGRRRPARAAALTTSFFRQERGAAAVEYGILMAMIALMVAAVVLLGDEIKVVYDSFAGYF